MGESEQLSRLVEAVRASRKYRRVSAAFVRDIGMRELARGAGLKEAIKATKNKLHQVGGVYLEGEAQYAAWERELEQAAGSGDEQALRRACMRVMARHASTRERLPILEQFYATVLAALPPIHSVLDVACGLHPLALPWMPFGAQVRYYACDIYEDMVAFLNAFFACLPVQGRAEVCDVVHEGPTQRADLAFVLKALPCLEQVDRSAGRRLLERLDADYLLVSFPARSLGGQRRGMPANYEAHFHDLVDTKGWSLRRFEFASELAFLVDKRGREF